MISLPFWPLLAVFNPSSEAFIGLATALISVVVVVQLLIRFQHAQLRAKRERLELNHQAHLYRLEEEERLARFEDERHRTKRTTGGDPHQRINAAVDQGTVFEPIDDAVVDLQLRMACLDTGVDDESAVLIRYLPVSVYVGSNDPGEFYALHDAVVRLLEACGFEIVSETRLSRGSIFQKAVAKLKSPATREELKHQAKLAQLALQQQTLGSTQADINMKQAEAASRVHQILDSHDDYVIIIGSLVGVTHQDDEGARSSIIVELTPTELIEFYSAGSALQDAASAYQKLFAMHPEEVLKQQLGQAGVKQLPRPSGEEPGPPSPDDAPQP